MHKITGMKPCPSTSYFSPILLAILAAASITLRAAAAAPAEAPAPVNPALKNHLATPVLPGDERLQYVGRTDANGNAIRQNNVTGHVSNYDEAKVPPYTLPDSLKLANGSPVKDADTWNQLRRPELIQYYQKEIYGHVPTTAPKVTFEVTSTDAAAMNGTAIHKQIVGHFGGPDGPAMNIAMYLPAKAAGPVPLVLSISFGPAPANPPSALSLANVDPTKAPAPAARGRGPGGGGGEPIADILARGYGYALVRYTEIEGDTAAANLNVVRKLALAPGEDKPAADEWGTISAWAWGLSRIMDYLETDKDVDAKRVAIVGHSRLGKTVLWAGAADPRFSIIFSSQGGELGSALGRRDYGETIDDMAQNFPWQFAGNLQKYVGRWDDLPVDTHLLIALVAPRPLLITGGTGDQWTDPHGEFLGEAAAAPVYRLLGAKDLGTTEWPKPETPLIAGDLAYYYHTGPHAITPADWVVFLNFAGKYWQTPASTAK